VASIGAHIIGARF